MKLAATGHRPNKLNFEYDLNGPMTKWLKQKTIEIVKELYPTLMISGMALGYDSLFALIAIELDIPLLAAIPCDNQEKVWPIRSQNLYKKILSYNKCTKLIINPGPYTNTCMHTRDEFMVNECDKLLAAWDGSSGGTGHTVKYAKSIGKEIIRIDPRDFYDN